MAVDHTHDPSLQSWVASANGHPDFPIQNLPLGVFGPLAGAPRGGIAIGDMILDLRAVHEEGLLDDEAQAAAHACIGPSLNPFLALGAGPRRALRDAAGEGVIGRTETPTSPVRGDTKGLDSGVRK